MPGKQTTNNDDAFNAKVKPKVEKIIMGLLESKDPKDQKEGASLFHKFSKLWNLNEKEGDRTQPILSPELRELIRRHVGSGDAGFIISDDEK